MMTGQILGGSPVTEAARYQVLIIWLIATINFSSVFMNTYMIYNIAFETGKHMLRTDRFIEVVRSKKGKGFGLKRLIDTAKSAFTLLMCCGKHYRSNVQGVEYSDIEQQPLSSLESYGTNKQCNIEIQSTNAVNSVENILQISNLQFSVPKGHTKQRESYKPLDASSSSTLQHRILCNDLDFSLRNGEIGLVRGPSGSGKSTLLRVISGLSPMDRGEITADGMSLSNSEMTRWRSIVRYVTQYKVDIPGSEYRLYLKHVI